MAIIAICILSIQFYESPHNARRAYNQTLPAVKTGQPLISRIGLIKAGPFAKVVFFQ